MPSTRSSGSIAALVATILLSDKALAEDGKFEGLTPYGKLSSSIKASQLDIGLDKTWDNLIKDVPAGNAPPAAQAFEASALRLFLRVPVTAGDDSTKAQLDKQTSSWRVGGRYGYSWGVMQPPGAGPQAYYFNWLSLSAEFGSKRFEYVPNGDEKMKTKDWHHSFAGEIEYRRFHGKSSGFQIFPQVRLRYGRDWKAESATAVVVPGIAPAPSTTKSFVLTGPKVSPQSTARIAVPLTLGSEFGLGPSAMYSLAGANTDYWPGAKSGRLRGEFFLYWFPSGLEAGGRIGLAPFFDWRTHGTDDQDRVAYGALIDLRLGTTLLEY